MGSQIKRRVTEKILHPIKKRGRPPIKIDYAMCVEAETLAGQGLTMKQIASALGMGRSTLYDKQAEFSDTIKKGKAKGIAAITNALFTKALAGNVLAMIFYLKNRDPENWADIEKRHFYAKDKEALYPTEYKVTYVHTDKPRRHHDIKPCLEGVSTTGQGKAR